MKILVYPRVADVGDNLVHAPRRKWLSNYRNDIILTGLHTVGYLYGIPWGSGLGRIIKIKDNQSICCLWLGDLSGNYEVYNDIKEIY